MSGPATITLHQPAASRPRLAWMMLLFSLLLTGLMFLVAPAASATPASVAGTALQVTASPDDGCPPELPDLVAISETKVENQRSAQPRGVYTPPRQCPLLTSPASTFVAATSSTLLQHAVLSARRYPPAPHLLLNPGHAPPRA